MVENFGAIRGQERAVGLLARYLEAGKVPQGLLFHGQEGTGKEKTAGAFAAALLCRDGSAAGACGACPDCRLAGAGSHPNLLRVTPPPDKEALPIDAVRALQEELALKAFSDRPRIAIIAPADRMTIQAANALLKTLEEPPAGTHLILVAHRLSALPPTVVSRCQKVPFSPLSREEVEAILSGHPEVRGIHPPGAIRAAAAAAGGSPGRALAAVGEGGEDRQAWLSLLTSPDPAGIVRAAAGWKGAAGDTAARAAVPLALLRDLALLSSGWKGSIMNEDLRDAVAAASTGRGAGRWTEAFRDLLALSRMPPQAQKSLALEAFLFGLGR